MSIRYDNFIYVTIVCTQIHLSIMETKNILLLKYLYNWTLLKFNFCSTGSLNNLDKLILKYKTLNLSCN